MGEVTGKRRFQGYPWHPYRCPRCRVTTTLTSGNLLFSKAETSATQTCRQVKFNTLKFLILQGFFNIWKFLNDAFIKRNAKECFLLQFGCFFTSFLWKKFVKSLWRLRFSSFHHQNFFFQRNKWHSSDLLKQTNPSVGLTSPGLQAFQS